MQSLHEKKQNLFSDDAILEVFEVIREEEMAEGVYKVPVKYTSHGKAIIQQQAVRGCTAAVAAMLIIDLKGKCDLHSLYATNLGNRESIEREFRKAQFEPQISFIKTMKELEKIVSVGSVMIDIVDPTLGNHEIVIDALDQTSVRLRDPWHGWAISIKRTALEQVLPFSQGLPWCTCIQIAK